ncbi:MAG: phytanoyl-CoA dioxygenase family protein [Ilumatobacteraceae bacterium]
MREEFERTGAVLVGDVFGDERSAIVHAVVEACRAAPGPYYGVLSAPGRPLVDSDLFRWSDVPALRDALFDGPLPRLAADLLGTTKVVFVEDQWFASAPGAVTPSPRHQDGPYYNIDGDFVTLWVALDDAPAAAGLRVVPGSHRWGRTFAPVEFGDTAIAVGRTGGLEAVPPAAVLDRQSLGWDVRRGDVVALHPSMLHSAGAQPIIGRWFRRLSTRWAAPDARCIDRGEQAAAFWKIVDHGLRTGDPLSCPAFPLLVP